MAKESREYTAFTDAAGRRWQYTVLEMGSPNSVSWVQSHMRAILSDIPNVIPYVDDIPMGDQGGIIPLDWDRKIETIPSKELPFEYMLTKVAKLFQIANEYNLRFNPKKSIFNATDLVIVGRKAVGGRTALDEETKARIRNLQHPTSMSDLLSTVGSLQWTRPFVPALSQAIAKWKLLLEPSGKNNTKLIPTEKTLRAFEHVKQMVADCKSLYP